jgi:CubicO group peptidase (beta-lactamase class C family)
MNVRRTSRVVVTCWLVLAACLAAGRAFAQALPVATPESVGMAGQRLDRMKAVMQEYVDQQQVAGVVTLIVRGGRVVSFEPVGRMDVEKNTPIRKDTIFRMASMSKAITSVAAMILVEEGKVRLSDPVSKFLPAFKQTSVAIPGAGSRVGIVPAKREITVRDLLTHTAGISYGNGPAADQWKAAGIQGWYLADRKEPIVPLIERLAALPFDAQPGEKYVYGYNTDILGAVIEKASGVPLDQFFQTRIFAPLKMTDSGFFLPPEKRSRLATVYSMGPEGRIVRAAEPGMGQGDYVDGPRTCFGGGAGLLSTTNDYGRFLQMLLNGGELDGARVLSPKTVELMTSNHVKRLYGEDGLGFGLGFEVTEQVGAAGRYDTVGSYGWGSAYYSKYWVDPAEKLVALFMTQLIPATGVDLQDKFRTLVYQAIVGPVAPPVAATVPSKRAGR